MTKVFREKVLCNGTVDTKFYRYSFFDCGDHGEIRCIPLACLDSTAALDSWETVEVIR